MVATSPQKMSAPRHIDLAIVRRETRWASGVPVEEGGSGDPSPATAIGLLAALKAIAEFLWGSEDLKGRRVAVQGVGKVGYYFTRLLIDEGVEVIVTDIYEPATARAVTDFGVKAVGPRGDHDGRLRRVRAVRPGRHPQREEHPPAQLRGRGRQRQQPVGERGRRSLLAERGILYAPDFLVNAGGLINVFEELNGYSEQRAMHHVHAIGPAHPGRADGRQGSGVSFPRTPPCSWPMNESRASATSGACPEAVLPGQKSTGPEGGSVEVVAELKENHRDLGLSDESHPADVPDDARDPASR